jgi:hypothetical protein
VHKTAGIGLSVAVMIVSGYAVFAATAWPWKAALFPLVIGIPLFCLATTELLWTLLGAPPQAAANEVELSTDAAARRRVLQVAGWMLAFFAAIALLGFPIAVPLFVFLYLRLQGGEGWIMSIVITVATSAVFYGLFDALLHLPFPSGWLLDWLGLA